jgi:poly-gamma-glutamate synthesis protein (capsule biosynthesis protein)
VRQHWSGYILYCLVAAFILTGFTDSVQRPRRAAAGASEQPAACRSCAGDARSPELHTITLTFLGDLMAHGVHLHGSEYDAMYDRVEPLFREDDLTFTNLESVLDPSRKRSSYPRFNVHPDYVAAAIRAGIDVFSVANNHSLDAARKGARATRERLRHFAGEYGIHYSGIRDSAGNAFAVRTITNQGWRIGFLAVTQFVNWGTEGREYVHIADYRDPVETQHLLDSLARITPRFDLFVLSYHGGTEYRLESEPAKRVFFRNAVDAGADIVWGHHPHVLQRWELRGTARGTRKLIMYSLGNFISGQTHHLGPGQWRIDRAHTGDGLAMRVEVALTGGDATVLEAEPIFLSATHHTAGEAVVAPLPQAVTSADSAGWERYYRRRRELLEQRFRRLGPAAYR